MHMDLLYILAGIICGVASLFGMLKQVVHHLQDRATERIRQTDALERNTEATEKLNESVARVGEVLDAHEKRLDRLDYKVFGFNGAHV